MATRPALRRHENSVAPSALRCRNLNRMMRGRRLTGVDAMRVTDPGSQFGFLMVPKFSLGALSSAIESLRLANYVSGQTLYEWHTVSADGEAVASSAGLSVAADLSIGDAVERLSTVFVCGGIDTHLFEDARLAVWLRQIERRGTNIGALCTGSHVLARLGLLDGYRCTIHWENLPGFIEDFPSVEVSEDIFVIDRNRYTCAGGMAASDMMLSFINRDHGYELAAAVSEGLVCERIRGEDDHQRMALRLRLAVSQPKLLATINVMSENIEAPLSQTELARGNRPLDPPARAAVPQIPELHAQPLLPRHAAQPRARPAAADLHVGDQRGARHPASSRHRTSRSPTACTSATRRATPSG